MKPFQTLACIALAGFFCLPACKNEPKTPVTPTENPAPPPSPKPEVYLYSVSVDKLNLREQPNKNATVIKQLAEGDFVEGAGEISANKEEVTLRGIPYNEPYFKVATTTPEQQKGWAYSAGLIPVYAGSRTTLPDLGKLSQFSLFLKSLNVKNLDSGKKALDYVDQNLANGQGTMADASFMLLEKFLFRMEVEGDYYKLTEKIKWADTDYAAIDQETFDMKKYPGTMSLAENGFRLEQGEGMVYPVVDWAKLAATFSGRVTPPMKNYLEQSVKEQKDKMWDDGGVIIPLEQVADRAVWWENFNVQNPYFVRKEETLNNQESLLFILICGADNTPVFNSENGTVSEDYKKAWAYVQQKYPGTEVGKAVKEMAGLVAAEGGKRNKNVDSLMQKYMTE